MPDIDTKSTIPNDLRSDALSTTSLLVMSQEEKTWFIAALDCDHLKMTQMLKTNPQLAHWKNYVDGNTALHYAAKFGQSALIRLLVGNYNAKVNVQNHAGLTALHLAAMGCHADSIMLLTSVYNANTCIRDFSGQLPSAYLPKTSIGDALQRLFRNPLQMLLKERDNLLYLLLKNSVRARSRSKSPAPVLSAMGDSLDSSEAQNRIPHFLPTPANFPWQQGGQYNGSDDELASQLIPWASRPSFGQKGSRESSRERHRKHKNQYAPESCKIFGSQRNFSFDTARMSLHRRKEPRWLTLNQSKLFEDISAFVCRKYDSRKSRRTEMQKAAAIQPLNTHSSKPLRSTARYRYQHHSGASDTESSNKSNEDSGPPTPTNEQNNVTKLDGN